MQSLDDVARRVELTARVTDALVADPRVGAVEPFGSLVNGKADKYSDVDLLVHLHPGVVDRDLWADLPEVLRPVGSAVHGWSFQALGGGQYGASFLFDDYPLFWAVDIGCVTNEPTDPSDVMSTYRWEQIYKVWLSAAKAVARSRDRLKDVRVLVEKHQPVLEVQAPDAPLEELRHLLDAIERRKISRGDPYEHLHNRCLELLRSMSEP
jgi:predicted nucleotidyltransferase